MEEFKNYLKRLADHEEEKAREYLNDPRNKILVYAGVHLNWLGDFFANPEIVWEKRKVSVFDIKFAASDPAWTEILINQCERSVKRFLELIKEKPELKNTFNKDVYNKEGLLLIRAHKDGGFIVLDGMPKFVYLLMDGEEEVEVYLPVNEKEELPICEPHVIYDLIRGFTRNASDAEGAESLYHGLLLLCRAYRNASELLIERFNATRVFEKEVQDVIVKVLKEM